MKYKKETIPDFPNYSIDTDGVIYDRHDRVMILKKMPNGYRCIGLRKTVGGKPIMRYVHRLVAHTFLAFPLDSKLHVHHKNHIKHDNSLINVEPMESRLNASLRKSNNGLPAGVHLTANGRYQAKIQHKSRQYCLGTFDDMDDASNAYQYSLNRIMIAQWTGVDVIPNEIKW